jgi:hypothetical protein
MKKPPNPDNIMKDMWGFTVLLSEGIVFVTRRKKEAAQICRESWSHMPTSALIKISVPGPTMCVVRKVEDGEGWKRKQ